jgi:hypothetical protein
MQNIDQPRKQCLQDTQTSLTTSQVKQTKLLIENAGSELQSQTLQTEDERPTIIQTKDAQTSLTTPYVKPTKAIDQKCLDVSCSHWQHQKIANRNQRPPSSDSSKKVKKLATKQIASVEVMYLFKWRRIFDR